VKNVVLIMLVRELILLVNQFFVMLAGCLNFLVIVTVIAVLMDIMRVIVYVVISKSVNRDIYRSIPVIQK